MIETSLTTIIFLRTSVEPEHIYLLSPSHLSSFTDAGMDKKQLLRLPPSSWRSEKVDVKFGKRMGRESDP